ncbi:3-oxoacyl-ACP synthase III family protein [Streptomyces fuscichromogenes]|uniref:3-oxoacyl-[acyl-carrier-protein] synthase 3 n=1 Tax=Streptomyces fuscichromogenes TaxID=1324013 RepID=A0A918CWD5_9ACTN|nr:ketoacyl-ACP synthase III [Streptomyces fuscichromogenes]GGN39130.1 3-oxoacyl-[acyl-carrier-protein] synthase 3 [Streptomyces fuscichromogenes]
MTSAIGILGTGAYVPAREVGNDELAARIPDTTAEWILRKTAIRSRRYAAPDEAASDLAAGAAQAALADAGLTADRVDHIIVCTSTGDYPLPPTASVVQQLVGADSAACFDLNAVCAGFVYGLEVARGLITARPGAHVLLIGVDVYSRFLDFSDRRSAVLLGDGAGAVVLGAVTEGHGILGIDLSTRGDAQDLLRIPAGGSRSPASPESVAAGGHFLRMQGRAVREFVLENIPPSVDKLLADAGVSVEEIDCFVPHQANGVLIQELAARCGLAGTPLVQVVEQYGNIGSASVPIGLDHAVREGTVEPGGLVLLSAFGSGMSVGNGLLRWGGGPA